MTQSQDLEIKGDLRSRRFADVICEIANARLSGSLRFSADEYKAILYFENGRAVFAVSNSRIHRLVVFLLRSSAINEQQAAKQSTFANDFEFASYLRQSAGIDDAVIRSAVRDQVAAIIGDLLERDSGQWLFNPAARIKGNVRCEVDLPQLLLETGRHLPYETIAKQISGNSEISALPPPAIPESVLNADEASLLSAVRRTEPPQTVTGIIDAAGFPGKRGLQAIYSLWLSGFLNCTSENPAFPEPILARLRSTHFEAKPLPAANPQPVINTAPEPPKPAPAVPAVRVEIELDDYLKRIDTGGSHYDLLGVTAESDTAVIRSTYYALAKLFHPDKFHKESPDLMRRIQHAFTQISQAHDVLRNDDSRKAYDTKLRSEQPAANSSPQNKAATAQQTQVQRAEADYLEGRSLLDGGRPEEALPFLARAVHYAPSRAEFHAYLGLALSNDDSRRHKAEGEIQMAIKLEPKNAEFRIMLAEFFVRMNLMKRALGELKRLLDIDPDNRAAQRMLARIGGG